MARRHRDRDMDVDDTSTRHAYSNGHGDRGQGDAGMGDDAEAEGGGYSNVHRAFLQAFLARSVMSGEEVRAVLARVMGAADPSRPTHPNDITTPLLTHMLQTINARLAPLDYEIRSTRDQQQSLSRSASSSSSSMSAPANDYVYALVNTASDALTQLATEFSAEEIAFVKRVLDTMFEAGKKRGKEVMAVEAMEARRLAKVRSAGRTTMSQMQMHLNGDGDGAEGGGGGGADGEASAAAAAPVIKGIDLATADAVLSTLVDQGFFRKQKLGGVQWFSLAPRGIMELRSYLKEMYNDAPAGEDGDDEDEDDEERVVRIRDCEGCREIVTWGLRCARRDCGVRFHDGCAGQYFGRRRGGGEEGGNAARCPSCRTEWTGDCYVGPRAVVGAGGENETEEEGGRDKGERE
ncbi:uncharacterized protein EI97DRAFT_495587 [Westerdykella ornata]|uniref:Non-structural maintenance of chromosomes element 1 homolog n=1 Tax=Westerdykella ornata TaxID=318751 RepID=A0A6A6JC38_WESOR|nr:uncharacterized protein EI97DRAFT_495587 [Westerdykella ornata]KAF2274131.1 hypothetical protein EI97DRAFT_495587 [Westerdykella ornata]